MITVHLPKTLFLMRWLFPCSFLWFLLTASVIPTYEGQVNYIVSISALFFTVLNAFFAWAAGIYLSVAFSEGLSIKKKTINVVLALLFNVWGQYHFLRKVNNVDARKEISPYDLFYLFFLFIICVVSYMMSVGVGNGS